MKAPAIKTSTLDVTAVVDTTLLQEEEKKDEVKKLPNPAMVLGGLSFKK